MTWRDWNPYQNVEWQKVITALAVSMAIAAMCEWFRSLRRTGRKYPDGKGRFAEAFLWGVLLFYLYTILCATLLGRDSSARSEIRWQLFWTLRAALDTGRWEYWYYLFGNILLFVPLGCLLPAVMSGRGKLARTVALCFLLSCAIEVMQYVTGRGLSELDDVMHNTIGGVIGYFISRIGLCALQKSRTNASN